MVDKLKVDLPLTLSEAVIIAGMRSCGVQMKARYVNEHSAWFATEPLALKISALLEGVSNEDAAWAVAAVLQTILRNALEVPLDAVSGMESE